MMPRNAFVRIALSSLVVVACTAAPRADRWTPAEIEELRSLWIGSLEVVPLDPTNRVADDPRAAELGRRLFFDTRLSSNGRISCASCHQPDTQFQDGTPRAVGIATTNRRTMPIAGTAYSPFLFWDGRKDSQWAQALGPLESPVEHGGTRAQYAHVIADQYRPEYEALFGSLPEIALVPRHAGPVPDPATSAAWQALTNVQRDAVTGIYVNIGKVIAAYERGIQYGPSRFDSYVKALVEDGQEPHGVLSGEEVAGLELFTGKANCTQCHNGPLLTNQEFHNTGVPAVAALPTDRGRVAGTTGVLADEFNCRSRWSDAPNRCKELEFMTINSAELEHAFKVPSLRNVANRAPYMHAGQIATLTEVLAHYKRAPKAPSGHSEIKPLKLNARELQQLEAFLRALSGVAAERRQSLSSE
jgi:cytochrome c peroxidase